MLDNIVPQDLNMGKRSVCTAFNYFRNSRRIFMEFYERSKN